MRRTLTVAVVILGLGIAGCSSSSKSESASSTSAPASKNRPKVTITAHDFAFSAPAKVPSGYVDVTLENKGKEDHHAQLVKLGSMSFADFKTVAEGSDLTKIKPGTIFVGGPNGVAPGKSVTTTAKLEPGAYAVVCFIPGADGKAHVVKGMIGELEAAESADSVNAAPAAVQTVTLGDFSFTPTDNFSGQGLVDISNQGVQIHELVMLKEAPGASFEEVKAALLTPPGAEAPTGPPPFTSAGGVVGLSPQQHAWLDLDLTPGKYVMVCFFSDPQKGNIPHAVEGMLEEFTVT